MLNVVASSSSLCEWTFVALKDLLKMSRKSSLRSSFHLLLIVARPRQRWSVNGGRHNVNTHQNPNHVEHVPVTLDSKSRTSEIFDSSILAENVVQQALVAENVVDSFHTDDAAQTPSLVPRNEETSSKVLIRSQACFEGKKPVRKFVRTKNGPSTSSPSKEYTTEFPYEDDEGGEPRETDLPKVFIRRL